MTRKEELKDTLAKLLCELIYLSMPLLLFYAPFYHGNYSYFGVIRYIIFSICALLAFSIGVSLDDYLANENSKYMHIFTLIAIIYNPILPLHLSRDLWMPIDWASAVFLLWYYIERKIYHRTHPREDKKT